MKYFILFLALFSLNTEACDYINLGFVSHHFDDSREYNEKNYGLGCENVKESGFDIIAFKNSHNRVAASASIFLDAIKVKNISLGVQMGVMLGYDSHRIFLITPRVEMAFDRFGIDVFLIPDGVATGFKVRI